MILARNQLPARVGGFGGMMLALIGMLLAAPLFVGGMIALVSPMLRNILPVEARIAADNLTRSPGRTGLVIGTLAAGVTVMVQTAGVAHSNEKPFTTWLNQMLRADLYVFGGSMATGTSSGAPMEASVVTALGQQPGVLKTTAIRFARPEFNGTIVYLIAVDAASFAETMTSRGDGPADLYKYRAVRDDRVVVSENFADRHRIRPGQTITLTGVQGPVTLTVIDTVVDYSWSRGTIFMDRSAFAERFGDRRVDLIHVFAKPGEMDTAKRNAEAYGSTLGLTVVERAAAQELLIGLIDRLSLLAYLQQIVVGIVASLGVVTALLISVLQRKRELGLLLAVGATPGQILRSVLWEAGFMGLLGTTLGLLVGFPLEWYAVRILVYEESGFSFAVLMPWRAVLTITTGAIALATLAGVLPAIKAVRTRVVDAITYE
jgi:putative ABC transport system permease protein